MKLKVGDVVEFKKYEDITEDEIWYISEEDFPKSGKIMRIKNDGFFFIEGYRYLFDPKSVTRIINNENRFNPGDEVLVKATVKEVFNGFLQVNSSIDKTDIIDILKRKEPEHFIVQEDHYGMYIGTARELVIDKSKAKLYASLYGANEAAVDMQLDDWDVIKYGD